MHVYCMCIMPELINQMNEWGRQHRSTALTLVLKERRIKIIISLKNLSEHQKL